MKRVTEIGIVIVAAIFLSYIMYWCSEYKQQEVLDGKYLVNVVMNDDRHLAVDGSHEAILIYFHSHNEVCKTQEPIVHQIAKKYACQVKVASINCIHHSSNSSHMVFVNMFNIHTTPTFVLRLKGRSAYSQLIGFQRPDQLEKFINDALR